MKLRSLILAAAVAFAPVAIALPDGAFAQTTTPVAPVAPTAPVAPSSPDAKQVQWDKEKALHDERAAQREGRISKQDEEKGNIGGAKRAERKEIKDERRAMHEERKEYRAKRREEFQVKRDDIKQERGQVREQDAAKMQQKRAQWQARREQMQTQRQTNKAKWQSNKATGVTTGPSPTSAPVTTSTTN